MTKIFNPWIDMSVNSQRRVDININYDFFWIVDIEGRYGFCIESKSILEDSSYINLKGITIKKVNSDDNSRLYLILNQNEDYEIFIILCQDLINTANKYDNSEKIIIEIENRLIRWQQLLKNNYYKGLNIERQMGLFSELIFLKNRIANEIGMKEAILSWVGAEFDKQDFLIEQAVIEVKSYKTTKGEIVHISSIDQLQSPKEPLYLATYALTKTERGLSVLDIIESIKGQIEDEITLEIFELKLFEYGYICGLQDKNKLYKFVIDKESIYEVNDLFPRIQRRDIAKEIISVKYAIDLKECKNFEVDFDSIFEVGGAI